jgi:AraC-like DNA-binding protein
LSANDPIFDGQEAMAMRQLLGSDAQVGNSTPRPSSLAEQSLSAARLDAAGLLRDLIQATASFGLEDFGPAGRAVLYAPTLADVEKTLRNLAPLLNLRHFVSLKRCDGGLSFVLKPLAGQCGIGATYLLMLDCVKLHRFLNDILCRQGISHTLEHRHAIAAGNEVPLPCELAGSLPRTNLAEFRRHEKAARKQMRELEQANLPTTVRRMLIAGAAAGDRLPDLAGVAKQLGYSQRTFRRRLTERGTSFMDCVNDVRQQLALRYLATTNCTVDVIAERLGYSDTANFRHAFRRWTGVSPRAYVGRAAADLPVTVMRTHREDSNQSVALIQ